jgi:glycogen operon protein
MLTAGDECRRTQRGNNNAYCQDNAISWFDWNRAQRHDGLRRFCRALIAFRKAEPTVRQSDFLDGELVRPGGLPDASWYNAAGGPVDWSEENRSLTYLLAAQPQRDLIEPVAHSARQGYVPPRGRHVLMMFHAGTQPQQFTIPPLAGSLPWQQFVNTAAESPLDVYPEADGPAPPAGGVVELEAKSLVCYVARDEL